MGNAGLEWNMKKCKVMHIERGKLVMLDGDIRLYDNTIIECLKDSESYKFLGVPESDTHKVSDIISHLKLKVQQRCDIIWSSPLSDYYKVMATNMQFLQFSIICGPKEFELQILEKWTQ